MLLRAAESASHGVNARSLQRLLEEVEFALSIIAVTLTANVNRTPLLLLLLTFASAAADMPAIRAAPPLPPAAALEHIDAPPATQSRTTARTTNGVRIERTEPRAAATQLLCVGVTPAAVPPGSAMEM